MQEANVRAPRYHILRAVARCPRCGTEQALVALLLAPLHEVRWADAQEEGVDPVAIAPVAPVAPVAPAPAAAHAEAPEWEAVPASALLFHLEVLDDAVVLRLVQHSPTFARIAGSTAGAWSNHCPHCHHPWRDEDCFCEPGGPFLPTRSGDLAALTLIPVEEPLEAVVGGYSPDPDFLVLLPAP
jgi:hypothetical protein